MLAVEEDPADENHERSMDNLRRLELAIEDPAVGALRHRHAAVSARRDDERRAAAGELRQLLHRQRRRDRADVQRRQRPRRARHAGASSFPTAQVVGIHAVDLVWGLGTLHCLTQQEPLRSVVITATTGGVLIDVRVIPRAKRSGLAGSRGDALLVRLQSPPVDGAANAELIEVLAAALGVTRREVTIVAGERSVRSG